MAHQPDADVAPESEAVVTQEATLTQLFEQMRLQEATEAMRGWDIGKLQTELSLAFASVAHAPSSFLQCVDIYSHLPNKQVAFISQWIEAAVDCIRRSSDPEISSSDSQLAASMLPALKRSRMPFVADFALAYQIDTNSLASFCLLLISTRVGSAVRFMECLKMKHLLPTDVVLDHVIKQKDFCTGDMFVKGHRQKQQQFVQMLIDYNVQDKVIKKRLTQFKLKASAFPVYFERYDICIWRKKPNRQLTMCCLYSLTGDRRRHFDSSCTRKSMNKRCSLSRIQNL